MHETMQITNISNNLARIGVGEREEKRKLTSKFFCSKATSSSCRFSSISPSRISVRLRHHMICETVKVTWIWGNAVVRGEEERDGECNGERG